jgi:RNA polymerase sigma-70 factor (ECF subfamily)
MSTSTSFSLAAHGISAPVTGPFDAATQPVRRSFGWINPDQALVQKARAGDTAALNALVERHYGAIFNLAHRLTGNHEDAQDLVSETFIRMYKALPNFRGDSRFSTWLYSIAKNLFLSEQKRMRRRRHVSLDATIETEDDSLIPQIVDPCAGPEELVTQKAADGRIQEAVRRLPAPHRLMITLFHFQHCGYDDIAEILDLPVGTVKSRLNRARLALRSELASPYYQD